MSVIINEMYLIHDWLYESKNEAIRHVDGKDQVTKVFVLLHEEDNNKEIYSPNAIMLFNTRKEAEEEKKQMEE